MGSDLTPALPAQRAAQFQSTLPHGERHCAIMRHGERKLFQSTLPHGERLKEWAKWHYAKTSFNPRSRMGSDEAMAVSSSSFNRFNPRSRMGSDITLPAVAKMGFSFNPRSRMGSDEAEAEKAEAEASFNPRSRMGSDDIWRPRESWGLFQSTLPHGERRVKFIWGFKRYAVSIHAPAWGATKAHLRLCYTELVSIHAPAWGATRIFSA